MRAQAIAEGKIDFAILGRQMLADPEFANKAKRGHEDQIRRCLRCYKCFPGSPEEGYDDLPFTSEELALYVGHCTINPLAHLPFDPDTLAPASKQETVLIVGGGAAGHAGRHHRLRPGPEGHPGPSRAPAWAACCGSPTWTPTSPT